MKQAAVNVLRLGPRTEAELHKVVNRFEAKWRRKVNNQLIP